MAITAISRDLVSAANIVHVVSSDTLATCAGANYVANQDANITALNNGAWNWQVGDTILVEASDGNSWFEFSGDDFSTFIAMPPAGSLSNVLASGRIFVGSAGNVATGVAMSGDATMANTGALTIANDAITTAKILNNAVTSAKLALTTLQYVAVPVTAAEFNGMYAAPKLLIAAGGANTLIVIERAVLAMTFVAAAYAAGGVVALQYDNTVHGAGVAASNTEAAADFAAAASTSFAFNGVAGDTVGALPFSTTVNKGIYISNATGAFTTGDGTWVMHLWYKVIPTV